MADISDALPARDHGHAVAIASVSAGRVHERFTGRAVAARVGYVIHHAPGPVLAVQPSVELAKRFSQQRIDPLIEEWEGGG